MRLNRKSTTVISTIGLLFIGLVVSLISISIPKTTILYSVAPGTVTVSIDNKPGISVKTGETASITPGTHSFTVSRDQFDSYTTKLTVASGSSAELLVALTAKTDAAQALLGDDISQAIVQRFFGNTMKTQTDDINSHYPIIKHLPITSRLYTINACPSQKYPNDTTKIALCVTETDSSLDTYALQAITDLGYNPADYEIIFIVQSADN
jgi:hypothetical protein